MLPSPRSRSVLGCPEDLGALFVRPATPRTAEWPAPLIRNGHGSAARARSTGVPRLPRDLHAPHRVVTPAGLVAIGLLVLLCSAHLCAAGAAARCEAFCRRYGPPDLVLALGDDTSDEKTFAAVQQWSTEQRCLHSAIPRTTSRLPAPLSLVRERGPSDERPKFRALLHRRLPVGP